MVNGSLLGGCGHAIESLCICCAVQGLEGAFHTILLSKRFHTKKVSGKNNLSYSKYVVIQKGIYDLRSQSVLMDQNIIYANHALSSHPTKGRPTKPKPTSNLHIRRRDQNFSHVSDGGKDKTQSSFESEPGFEGRQSFSPTCKTRRKLENQSVGKTQAASFPVKPSRALLKTSYSLL